MSLEGKELEGKIGDGALGYSVDLSDKGVLAIAVEVDLVVAAKALAAKTGTPIDDTAIAWLEKLMGR